MPHLRAGRPVAGGDRLDRCLVMRSGQVPPGSRPRPPGGVAGGSGGRSGGARHGAPGWNCS